MKIALIKGSPHGKNSFTRICTEHLKSSFPEHTFIDLNVGKSILRLEKSDAQLNNVFKAIAEADTIIWSFPVYVLLVPSQLVRFIELIQEKKQASIFTGKYATAISTSANFFDHTAHRYIQEICEDLKMPFLEGFSASMIDMLEPKHPSWQTQLTGFAESFFRFAENRIPPDVSGPVPTKSDFEYQPDDQTETVKTGNRRLVIITDARDDELNLKRMIEVFVKFVAIPVTVLNLNDVNIRGGCVGCLRCMNTGQCTYHDDFEAFFKKQITPADGIVFASTIKHRYFSSSIKQYHDRGFVNGHRPIFEGKPIAHLISGPLRQLPNLRQIVEAYGHIGGTPSMGIVSDEGATHKELTRRIQFAADSFSQYFKKPWTRPANFLGVGGRKIFRDLVYQFKDLMVEDHAYYLSKGLYDFPDQKDR
jgi:multimeric flavodoxin WrbA